MKTKKISFSITLARDILLILFGAFFPIVMQAVQYYGAPSNWNNGHIVLIAWIVIGIALLLIILILRLVNKIDNIAKKKQKEQDDERDRKLKAVIKEIIRNELARIQNK